MILLSSRFFGKNRKFRYYVTLVHREETGLYCLYVDCVYKCKVKNIVSLELLTYHTALQEFYDNILIFSGITIVEHGQDII